jgi:hypothetical protein
MRARIEHAQARANLFPGLDDLEVDEQLLHLDESFGVLQPVHLVQLPEVNEGPCSIRDLLE